MHPPLIVGGACEVNGGQAKYDLLVLDDRKTGLFLAGWIMAQQSGELQQKAIEEIKEMGVCNVFSLQPTRADWGRHAQSMRGSGSGDDYTLGRTLPCS